MVFFIRFFFETKVQSSYIYIYILIEKRLEVFLSKNKGKKNVFRTLAKRNAKMATSEGRINLTLLFIPTANHSLINLTTRRRIIVVHQRTFLGERRASIESNNIRSFPFFFNRCIYLVAFTHNDAIRIRLFSNRHVEFMFRQ